VAAALELQRAFCRRALAAADTAGGAGGGACREVQELEADFYGPVVNRCARLRAIGHGFQ
jgi:hypothetical protein